MIHLGGLLVGGRHGQYTWALTRSKDTRRKRGTGCGAGARGGVGQLVEGGGVEVEEGGAVAGDAVCRGRVVGGDVAVLVVGQRLWDREGRGAREGVGVRCVRTLQGGERRGGHRTGEERLTM